MTRHFIFTVTLSLKFLPNEGKWKKAQAEPTKWVSYANFHMVNPFRATTQHEKF